MILNIYSKGKYPANILSNFSENTFDFDGFCNIPSMESFLQSLKFSDLDMQRKVLYMEAKVAKCVGSAQHWQRTLTWKGTEIDRFSREYAHLIESAYRSLLANADFRKALRLNVSKEELGEAIYFDHVVINKDINLCADEIAKIIIPNK